MKKKLISTSWLISQVTSLLFLVMSIAVVSNYRIERAKQSLHNYLSFSTLIYNGDNSTQLATDVSKVNIKLKLTIIDFSGNVIYNSNTYNSFSNHLDREEVKDLGTVYFHRSLEKNQDILYIAGRDSSNYIILAMPMPSIANIVSKLILTSIGIFILIAIISYYILKSLNEYSLKPLQNGVKKLSVLVNDESNNNDYDINSITNKLQNIHNGILEKINTIIDEKEKKEFVIENMNQGIMVLDSLGSIVLINDYATNIFKNPKDKVNVTFLGKHYLYLIRNAVFQNHIEDTIEKGTAITFDITIDDKIYLVSINPSRNKWTVMKGKRNGVAILILDVTERRNLEHTKRDFFANASHELKSPLTTILGYQQMISENMISTPEEIDDAVKRTIKEAKRMDKILGEMLDLSRIESKFNVVIEDLNLKDIIEDSIDSYTIDINDKNIIVNAILEDYHIKMNNSHCTQLLNNLIDNAIKYNNNGGKLDIILKDNILIIKDTGIGIAKTDQNRVFERFYRVDKGRSKELGGTGLGLAIVKHICSVYSIGIILKSDLNIGTEFKLTFPNKK